MKFDTWFGGKTMIYYKNAEEKIKEITRSYDFGNICDLENREIEAEESSFDTSSYNFHIISKNENEIATLIKESRKILVDEKAGDPLYRYGRQQTQARYDPSAIEEDLGDNAMKAGDYGIKNLKYILKHLSEWLQDDPDFSHRSSLYGNIANQYLRYISNAAYNVGGIYLTAVKEGTKGKTYEAVPREVQKEAMQWVIRQMRNCDWVDKLCADKFIMRKL